MKRAFLLLSCVASSALLTAQSPPQESAKPYQEGNVDQFLLQAKERGRPSLVLFNFSLKSG
jgi:hypothetical protein